ncbi:hypothetical protein ONS95_011076 [Cadophora gregata]|uniref:uncharacterized protein n=1 Tax=Cadophora gregata TaxID=51156 RepID=UPI0026DB1C5D|nr:uncharacterized protein ONS95_011076 [Cadophora gregata]KAK0119638.1 hypothetical protein ONS95_011076 [Cadophora gregata]KAK0120676.1 hypothetical protein ONS96_010876 [Cadophora gregata f. sp. sojae]
MPEPVPAPFTSVFRTLETQNQKLRRNRPSVSCTACQKRKLRCDRRQPCSACEKRGHQAACSFRPSRSNGDSINNDVTKQDVLSRLSKLEDMVREFADGSGEDGTKGVPAPKGWHAKDTANALPHDYEADDATVYYGSTSWAALVESIHDIQSVLESDFHHQPVFQEHDVVFGDVAPVNIGVIVSCMPPQTEADRLVSACFGSQLVAMPFLHEHHFQRQYEAFWESPSSTSILWISILFSVFSIGATISLTKEKSMVPPTSMFVPEYHGYTEMAARCLLSGQYNQAKIYSVEAILAHICSRSLSADNSHSDSILWSLHGLAVRIGQRRGYHRNPQIAKRQNTPFNTEMRRRAWFSIRSFDLAFSSQHGLPPIVHEEDCDVNIPRHLMDGDFDESCVELPPERSSTDPTPMLFYVQKAKLFPTFDRISRRALGVKPSTAELVMELSAALDTWHESIPPCLAYQPIISAAPADTNCTIMHRILLELMYLRSKGFLHCPYLVCTKGLCREPARSMDLCRDAAMQILHIQLQVDQATLPGGKLYDDRQIILKLTLEDFLNATIFLGVDLTQTKDISFDERQARIGAVRTSYDIWLKSSHESSDAKFACRTLQAILQQINPSFQSEVPLGGHSSTVSRHSGTDESSGAIFETNGTIDHMGDEDFFSEQDKDFEDFPSFGSLVAGMEPYSWNSIAQLHQNAWMDVAFPSNRQY